MALTLQVHGFFHAPQFPAITSTITQLHSPTFTMHSFKRIAFVVVVLASTYTLASCGQKGPLQLSVSAATGPASALNVPA
ncbi:MAG: putative small lipoprotein YifL [Burkholderiaceae bacterium]